MNQIISLNNTEEFYLQVGIYNIDIIGGWYIKLNGFNLELIDVNSNKTINPQKANLPYQSYTKGKRSKRVFKFEVLQGTTFKIKFNNSDKLIVKNVGLPIYQSLFNQEPVKNLKIKIYN